MNILSNVFRLPRWYNVGAVETALLACSRSRSHLHRECVCHSVHLLYSFVSPFISGWFDHLRIQNPLNNLKPQQKQQHWQRRSAYIEGRHQIIWATGRHAFAFARTLNWHPPNFETVCSNTPPQRKRDNHRCLQTCNGYKYSAASVLLIILSVHACKRWTSLNLLRLMAFDLPCIHISLDAIRWLCSTDSIKLYFASKH